MLALKLDNMVEGENDTHKLSSDVYTRVLARASCPPVQINTCYTECFILFIFILCVPTCGPMLYRAHKGEKMASDPLTLELCSDVSCHLGAENRAPILYKSSECFLQ